MNHSEKIRSQRRKLGVSQAELGIELGRTQTWACLLERGLIHLDEEKIKMVLAAIDRVADRKRAIAVAQREAAARVLREFEVSQNQAGR